MKTIIHGENVITPVDILPKGAKPYNTFIIGHSETGHNHVLEADKDTKFKVVTHNGEIYFQTTAAARIKHQKSFDIHETITVEPGIYKVIPAKEYNPFTKQLQQVWDQQYGKNSTNNLKGTYGKYAKGNFRGCAVGCSIHLINRNIYN